MAKQYGKAAKAVRNKSASVSWWKDNIMAHPEWWDETHIGIDWGETKNAYAVVSKDGVVLENGFVKEDPAALSFLLGLAAKYANPLDATQTPPFVIETPRRMLAQSLMDAGCKVLIAPSRLLKAWRKEKGIETKNDRQDAADLANIARVEPSSVHVGARMSVETLRVRHAWQAHKAALKAGTKASNRARSLLAEYNPTALRVVTSTSIKDSRSIREYLRAYPTHGEQVALDYDDTLDLIAQYQSGWKSKKAQRLVDGIQANPSLSYRQEIDEVFAEELRRLLDIADREADTAAEAMATMTALSIKHPLADILRTAPGVGPTVLAGLIATLGDKMDEFTSGADIAAYTAVAPTTAESGMKGEGDGRRKKWKTSAHRAMWDWAGQAQQNSLGAKYYYWKRIAKGDVHGKAMRKTGARLCSRLHHCWVNNLAWDDDLAWPNTPDADTVNTFIESAKQASHERLSAAVKNSKAEPRLHHKANAANVDLGAYDIPSRLDIPVFDDIPA